MIQLIAVIEHGKLRGLAHNRDRKSDCPSGL